MKTRTMVFLLMAIVGTVPLAGDMEWYALGGRQESAGPHKVEVIVGVTYSRAGRDGLKLDIYRPVDTYGPLPAVLLVHGGGWRYGDRQVVRGMARTLASNGFIAVPADYRFSGEAQWPGCLHDLKAAVRWLKTNAKRYRIDAERIAVVGDSAGGHLAAMLGTTGPRDGLEGDVEENGASSAVRAVAAYYGVFDLAAMAPAARNKGPLPKLLGARFEEQPESFALASPITYVDGGDPPFLLIHGLQDKLVPIDQSLRMEAALREAGVPVRLIEVANAGHMLRKTGKKPDPPLAEIDRQLLEFLGEHLARS